MSDSFSPLTVEGYAAQALMTDQRSDAGSLTFPLLGLFGESGSLLTEVKKKQRDKASYRGYARAVVEELGDVLWYLTVVAARVGLPLSEVVIGTNLVIDRRSAPNVPLTFADIQPAIMQLNLEPSPEFERTLLQLAGKVGLLISDQECGRLTENPSVLTERLIAIMRSLVEAANQAGVTLECAAVGNLAKIFDRWPHSRIYPEPLDEKVDPEERLPRSLIVDVFERDVRGRKFVYQHCNGINIGDRLTDNATMADDYRFHDVLHFAYVAVLGWSPVVRTLLRVKRKSDPKIDEVEDGARAALIEEGVTNWIFGQAMELDLFAGLERGDLPFDLLKHVKQFVAGYEVEYRPSWLWEEAILAGYEAFRFLREHRRARIHIDMNNHRLGIDPLP